MGSNLFISKKLQKNIEKDVTKRNKIENKIKILQAQLDGEIAEKIKDDLDNFYDEIDEKTILSTFKYVEESGTIKQKEILQDLKERFQKSKLLIEDTLNLRDWYEEMMDHHNIMNFGD